MNIFRENKKIAVHNWKLAEYKSVEDGASQIPQLTYISSRIFETAVWSGD